MMSSAEKSRLWTPLSQLTKPAVSSIQAIAGHASIVAPGGFHALLPIGPPTKTMKKQIIHCQRKQENMKHQSNWTYFSLRGRVWRQENLGLARASKIHYSDDIRRPLHYQPTPHSPRSKSSAHLRVTTSSIRARVTSDVSVSYVSQTPLSPQVPPVPPPPTVTPHPPFPQGDFIINSAFSWCLVPPPTCHCPFAVVVGNFQILPPLGLKKDSLPH